MKWLIVAVGLYLICGSSFAQRRNEPLERCSVTDCFRTDRIRESRVIDSSTLLIYVGLQRCAFLIEFSGTYCDLTFLPPGDVDFRFGGMKGLQPTTRGNRERGIADRICANDLNAGIDEGPFTTASGGEDLNARGRLSCQIRDVRSMTDDQVIELFVDNDAVAPPPPFGNGEITTASDRENASETGAAEGQGGPTIPSQ